MVFSASALSQAAGTDSPPAGRLRSLDRRSKDKARADVETYAGSVWRHLHHIEHWNLPLDVRAMLLTFARCQKAC
jgi:hypothetical protein